MSVLDNFKAVEEERLPDDAKAEALEAAHKAVAALNELGFPYRLVEGPQTAQEPLQGLPEDRAGLGVKRGTGPICEFRTEPQHDGGRIARRKQSGLLPKRNCRKRG